MKIKTQAHLARCTIDGTSVSLPEQKPIDLEFSTIDTGGGFKDPILDFSFRLDLEKTLAGSADHDIEITLRNPKNDRQVSFLYSGSLQKGEDKQVEVNGRLKDDGISREVVGFMLQLLR